MWQRLTRSVGAHPRVCPKLHLIHNARGIHRHQNAGAHTGVCPYKNTLHSIRVNSYRCGIYTLLRYCHLTGSAIVAGLYGVEVDAA